MKKIILLMTMLIVSSCGMQSIPTALNEVEAKWAEVQNQYKRRSDLIPNLVSTVKIHCKLLSRRDLKLLQLM
jgi:LemA protein